MLSNSLSLSFNIFPWLIALSACIYTVSSGVNNLHTYDGISSGELISMDIFFEIIDPEELGYTYRIRPAKDFGVPFNDSFSLRGIPLVPVHPPNGCGQPDNKVELEGSVALIERGECSFLSKAFEAEEAGALAVIISDNDGEIDNLYIEMVDDLSHREVNIPVGYLVGKNGHMIRKTLVKMRKRYALINIPVNLTYVASQKINQPPWIGW